MGIVLPYLRCLFDFSEDLHGEDTVNIVHIS